MRCRVCGVGTYRRDELKKIASNQLPMVPGDRVNYYICNNCGHLEAFLFEDGNPPIGWMD